MSVIHRTDRLFHLDQQLSMRSSSSKPPQVVWLYDSPLSMSRASSNASVTDLEVPTPYASSVDIGRASSPDLHGIRYQVVEEHKENALGLDLFAGPNDMLSPFRGHRIGSHSSEDSIQSGEYPLVI